MAGAGFVDHLVVHVDVVEEMVFASLTVDGVVDDVDWDRFG